MQRDRHIGVLRDDVNHFSGFIIRARGWAEFDRVLRELRGLCPGGTVRDLAGVMSAMDDALKMTERVPCNN